MGQKTITRTVARARLAALAALLLVAAFGLDAHAQSAVEQAITPNTTLRASLVSLSSMEVVRFSNDAQVSHGVITLLVEDHRGTFLGWEVTLHASDFQQVDGTSAVSMPASGFRLAAPGRVETQLGEPHGITVAAPGAALGIEQVVAQAPSGTGTGVYLLHLDVALAIPPQTPVGAYASHISVDISSAPGV